MKVTVKKLFRGHASVRDYIVKKCIKKKEDLTIKVGDDTKTFPYKALRTYLTNTSGEKIKSIYTKKKYLLIDFPWGKAQW